MAFLVQNDAGTQEGANAYIDVTFLAAYHLDRGTVLTQAEGVMQAAIVNATDYIDSNFDLVGCSLNLSQRTHFPVQLYGRLAGIPPALKETCAILAYKVLLGKQLYVDPTSSGRQVQSESVKVDVIEKSTVYSNAGVNRMIYLDALQRLSSAKLIKSGGLIGGVLSL